MKKESLPVLFVLSITLMILMFASSARAGCRLRGQGDDGKLSGPFVSLDGHASLFSDISDRSMLSGAFGYGARGGYRWNNWGLFLVAEHNLWVATEFDTSVVQGAVNFGVGADYIYGGGLVRTSLALGPSILAWDTILDDAGSVGFFLDIRPVGLRWAVTKILVIGFDPLNFAVVAPVLDGIPLINIQYRTFLYLEAAF